jgi:UPF0755 protein
VLLAGLTLFGLYRYVSGSISPSGPPGADVQVTITKGDSTGKIADILADKKVIKNARVFNYWSKLQGKGPYLPGRYTLPEKSDYDQVAKVLSKGPDVSFDRLTIPEGYTIEQIAERVGKLPNRSADKFKELAGNGSVKSRLQAPGVTTLEGLLFPSTYFIGDQDDEARILTRMVQAFEQVADEVKLADRARERGLTEYQAIILASLVEKEAKFDEERPQVAEVVYNRLEKNMRLEIDATVIYAQGQAGKKTRVTGEDLKFKSPYNTYLNPGLPPSPIAGSGEKSLEAALAPSEGSENIFYVVIDKEGHHAFAKTLAEHQANIRKAEQNGAR